MSNRNGVWSLPAQYQAIADQDWTMAPGAPTGVSATAGSTQAEVSFTAPTFAGIPGTITQFKVTSSSGQTATGSSSPLTVTGLTNGNAVTFTAQAQNAIGLGKASDASSSVTPLAEVISGLFSCHLYNGTGSAQTITNNINLSGKGGLVWFKKRSASGQHTLIDTVRGNTKYIRSSADHAEDTSSTMITAFNSNGFSVGTNDDVGANNVEYSTWTFRKEPKFFDIVTYTGNGSNRTISHNLASAPGMILIKNLSQADNWAVFHRSQNNETSPENYTLALNSTAGDTSGVWNGTLPTSSVFSVGTDHTVNANGENYVAYLFAHNNNDGGFGPDSEDIIKCGHFSTDGNEDATIDLGFEPQWVLFKRYNSSTGGDWSIYDNMRGMHGDFLSQAALLEANTSDAENATTNRIAVTSTGFKIDNYGSNRPFIYVAIRRPDMSTPTVASSVFAVDTRNSTGDGNEPGYRSTFPVDMVIKRKDTGQNSGETHVISRLTGTKYLRTYNSTSEDSDSGYLLDYMNGFNSATSTKTDRIAWMWKRAKGYFDVVAYSGTGSGAQNVTHNLGVVPEMMWIKVRSDGDNWTVYHSALGNTKRLILNSSGEASSANEIFFNNTTPTSSVFTAGSLMNASHTYIAHLFATVAGVSKVGSYTGNSSSTQDIDCGFTNGAKMVILKQTSHAESWEIYDTTRALVAGNDYRLRLDATDAQATNSDFIDPLNSGFTAVADSNLNGRSYIFYAIAND